MNEKKEYELVCFIYDARVMKRTILNDFKTIAVFSVQGD